MTILEGVMRLSQGAKFFRGDIHIHSYGASHDVTDPYITPQAIVATAVAEGLDLIAITDHNEISNVSAGLQEANQSGICLIPGVELSTPQGHLLCYLPDFNALASFYGRLNIVDHGLPNSRCQQSILECLNLLHPLAGFAILAHVDIASGFEFEVPGASPHKIDVLCHPALLGIELKNSTSEISYSDVDPNAERVQIGKQRIERLNLGSKQNLARISNSDSHTLNALGRNAANDKRVTRYKMEQPSFSALRIALEDADARVRIEDLIPQSIPKVLGIHLNGGFLSGQSIQFSQNLNCIIGGRGTGKSTAFEAVRCLLGDETDSKVIDSEVWPNELNMFWMDRAGQIHTLQRFKDGQISNVDDPHSGPITFDVDCFGQGEAAKISIDSQKNPLALLNYLDKFIDFRTAKSDEDEARNELLRLQSEIEKAEQQVNMIPQYQRALAVTQQQLSALQKPEVKDLIDLQRQLASENELRNQIAEKLQSTKQDFTSRTSKATIDELISLADPTTLKVGTEEYKTILDGAKALKTTISTTESQLNQEISTFEKIVNTQIAGWKLKENSAQTKIDDKRRELEAANIPFDMAYIAKLAKDEAEHIQTLKNLQLWIPYLANARKERKAELSKRWITRNQVSAFREAFGRQATTILRESLTDLQVSLRYKVNAYSPDAEQQIIQAMGWKTNQQPRVDWLIKELTIPGLLDAINKNDTAPIVAFKTPEGVPVFKKADAQDILDKLSQPVIKFALERAALHDLPRLQVSRRLETQEGEVRHIVRDFSKLSLGQQQSVLLALMLSANSDRPLIIDQPEDNLDGEFIYSSLVPVLRRAKERRQVIIVTHNANVAVLGDAELVIVMKAVNDQGNIVARGSIDHPETRDAACAILEGSQEAFFRRGKMYGFKVS